MNLGSILATILIVAFLGVFIYIAYIYINPMIKELKRRTGFQPKEKKEDIKPIPQNINEETMTKKFCPNCGYKL